MSPFRSYVNAEIGAWVVDVTGDGSYDSLKALLSALASDQDLAKLPRLLIDVTQAHYEPTQEATRRLSRVVDLKTLLGSRKMAIIVNAGLQRGLIRQFLEFSGLDDATAQLFSDWDSAVSWLTSD